MTSEQFNNKWYAYKVEGHYGLDIDIPSVVDYLDNLFPELIKDYPNFQYKQIKLKFNRARFYCEPHNVPTSEIEMEINNRVAEYDLTQRLYK